MFNVNTLGLTAAVGLKNSMRLSVSENYIFENENSTNSKGVTHNFTETGPSDPTLTWAWRFKEENESGWLVRQESTAGRFDGAGQKCPDGFVRPSPVVAVSSRVGFDEAGNARLVQISSEIHDCRGIQGPESLNWGLELDTYVESNLQPGH